MVVFAYNFPHRKTQDVLVALHLAGYEVDAVIAADPVELSIPPSTVRTKLSHDWQLHPADVAARLGMRYEVMAHQGEKIEAFLDELRPTLGVVAGARILKSPVIDRFAVGILNLHPGLIPEARGLDALLWSVRHDVPLGATAHLIDERVDAGRILVRRPIPIRADDTAIDLGERLLETQLVILPEAVETALSGDGEQLNDPGRHDPKMSPEMEAETLSMVAGYVEAHSEEP